MNKKNIVGIIIWVYFIHSAIGGGLTMAGMDPQPPESIPSEFYLFIHIISFVMFFVVSIVNSTMILKRKSNAMLNSKPINILDHFLFYYHPALLASIFFILIGGIGTLKCYLINSSILNKQILLIPVTVGFGFLGGWLLSLPMLRKPRTVK